MTLPRSRHRKTALGFTLIEVLITIAIIAILIALLLGALAKVRQRAARHRVATDLNSIAIALDAYKERFGDYPRSLAPIFDSSNPDNPRNYGMVLLCSTLIAPYPKEVDGADGPGFRTRVSRDPGPDNQLGTQDDVVVGNGEVFGPFLDASKFRFGQPPLDAYPWSTDTTQVIFDYFGTPILYFPARPSKPNLEAVDALDNGGYINDVGTGLYNSLDNDIERVFRHANELAGVPTQRFHWMLGDRNFDGRIRDDDDEKAASTGPFILWSAGPDGKFGPDATGPSTFDSPDRIDDITNFITE